MLLCEYLFLFDYSVRQFERLAELVRLQTQNRRDKEVNKQYLDKNTNRHHPRCIQFISKTLEIPQKTDKRSVLFFLFFFHLLSNEIRFAQAWKK